MNRSLRLIPVSALAAIALAACGSASNNSTVPSLGGGSAQQGTSPGSLAAARAAQIRAATAAGATLPTVSASDMQALLSYAACLRAHDLPRWPDPNAQGVFHVRSADAGTLTQAKRAFSACQALRSGTLARLDITPSGQ